MIPRYEQPEIKQIWSNENKLKLWQQTELAVLQAKVILGMLGREAWLKISRILLRKPFDITWWLARDKEINHDLNAFIDERRRYLPLELQPEFHKEITSYDTEESAFVRMLRQSIRVVKQEMLLFDQTIQNMARKYRYTIMLGKTHGQEAELQTFGKRCLTWLKQLRVDVDVLEKAEQNLKFSKISGAVGNYGGVTPEMEKEALKILGFKPLYGATQIMPRELYVPISSALCQIVQSLDKIATDIRLGARSGRPIYQEPFGGKQKGSSRMPHKKNTISTEQIEGMARMAQGYHDMIMRNIKTWEERAIEQSCVERVAWPDLFHITLHSLRVMKKVLAGLAVCPDNMLLEVINSRGCYASGDVKAFLGEKGVPFGLSAEEAYRVVQLAAFIAFWPTKKQAEIRQYPPASLEQTEKWLAEFESERYFGRPESIYNIIVTANLYVSPELDISQEQVEKWNEILEEIFENPANIDEFDKVFSVSRLLKNEEALYREILEI